MDSSLGLAFFLLWQLFLLIVLYMVGSWYVAGLRERISTSSWPGSLDSWTGQLAAWGAMLGCVYLAVF